MPLPHALRRKAVRQERRLRHKMAVRRPFATLVILTPARCMQRNGSDRAAMACLSRWQVHPQSLPEVARTGAPEPTSCITQLAGSSLGTTGRIGRYRYSSTMIGWSMTRTFAVFSVAALLAAAPVALAQTQELANPRNHRPHGQGAVSLGQQLQRCRHRHGGYIATRSQRRRQSGHGHRRQGYRVPPVGRPRRQ